MRVSISGETMENILNYLAEQPFKDVIKLWNEIQKDLKPIEDKPESDDAEAV